MGHSSLSASLCSPSFPNNQRLHLGYCFHGPEKPSPVSCTFQVRTDNSGFGIGSQIFQKVAGIKINAVTKADSLAIVDATGYPGCCQFGGDAAALRDEAHGAAFTECPHEERDLMLRAIYTYTVWADDANVSLPCLVEHLSL